MKRRMVHFHITEELLKQALAMPEDSNIIHITSVMYKPGVYAFYVEYKDFPELSEGSDPPLISPVFYADYEKRPSTWLTIDWNLPDQPIADS